ncbi:hypothetical protein EON65_37250 [archaeon]|nr:MAG: hypothetical protein EON65_37250 [archaeon]
MLTRTAPGLAVVVVGGGNMLGLGVMFQFHGVLLCGIFAAEGKELDILGDAHFVNHRGRLAQVTLTLSCSTALSA